jgi:small subunit ribosomal protein S1
MMSSDKPGLEEQKKLTSSAEEEQPEEVENIVDTQERTDAIAAVEPGTSAEEAETAEEEASIDESPVDNINTSDDLGPEEAGEIFGTPGESITMDEDMMKPEAIVEVIDSAAPVDVAATQDVEVVPDEETTFEDEPGTEAPSPSQEQVTESTEDAPASRFRRGDLVEGTILKTTPTAITVQLDEEHEGVIPGRELERMTRQTLEKLAEGEKIIVYVVNPHDHQGNVVLSINRAIEEVDWKEAEAYRANQQIYDGNVAGYNKGGLIVRFGSLRGFVPQSQISDERRRIMDGQTPEERYGGMVNDSIVVKVMEVDRSRNRLILSERAATREERERRKESLIQDLAVGHVAEGHVVSLEDFGVFVDIGGAEGLVHLTEIAWKHVTHPREALRVGQKVRVEVISVDRERKRIGLSIKRQEADPWDEVATTYQVGDLVQATITKLTKFGAFARLVDADDIEGLVHISELSEERVNHPRDVVNEDEKLTLRVVKIDVKNRRLGLSLKRVNSAEYLDRDLRTFASEADD